MEEFISKFYLKVEEMTAMVDKAAEEENYDEAERIQEDLEHFQKKNSNKVEKYRLMLLEPAKEEYNPPELDHEEYIPPK